MTNHPDISKISFTGSDRHRQEGDGERRPPTLKRLTLELGGNDAGIVLDDVDPKTVAPPILRGGAVELRPGLRWPSSGSTCPSSLYDELCGRAGGARRRPPWSTTGRSRASTIGPLQNKMQYEKVEGPPRRTHAGNGNVYLPAATAPGGPATSSGHPRPRDIDDMVRWWREEQFGPVLPVLTYRRHRRRHRPGQRQRPRPGRVGVVERRGPRG